MVRAPEFRRAGLWAHRAFVFTAACLVMGCGGRSGTAARDSGDVGSRPTVGCVDVSHVGALQKKDLRVVGRGFEAYEGLTIRLVVTLGEPAYGLGEAPIEG